MKAETLFASHLSLLQGHVLLQVYLRDLLNQHIKEKLENSKAIFPPEKHFLSFHPALRSDICLVTTQDRTKSTRLDKYENLHLAATDETLELFMNDHLQSIDIKLMREYLQISNKRMDA